MHESAAKFCVIVPAFNEEGRIGSVVKGIMKYSDKVIVVDDGSPDSTAKEAKDAGAHIVRHNVNRGKGVALESGFEYAKDSGFEFVITMDGDGQHDPSDIPVFLEAYEKTGFPVLIGNRMEHTENMPFVRRCTNHFMSWILSREMGQRVPDTQSGYRLYRCDILQFVSSRSAGFAAESEVLLNLAKAGVKMGAVPIKVIYRDEKSKISPVTDTIRFFKMLKRNKQKRPALEKDAGEKNDG